MRKGNRRTLRIAALTLAVPTIALAFTQGAGPNGVGVFPQGHEWLTKQSALELVGDLPADAKGDPRNNPLPDGKPFPRAANPGLTPEMVAAFKRDKISEARYDARYQPVLDAILGQRWVDIGGFNVAKAQAATINCFDNVPQLPDDIQRDHFMRQRADGGGAGAVAAMDDGVRRFVDYFTAAAMAEDGRIKAWDGGGYSVKIEADRHFFLLGRAIHIFQDSFSSDHTVRDLQDGYKSLRGIKTYLCSLHSDQHSRTKPFGLKAIDPKFYPAIGDVIWLSGRNDWTPTNVKLNALASVEGMKDVWAAFLRVMALPREQREAAARSEAQRVAVTWLSFDRRQVIERYDDPDAPNKIPGFVTDQKACDLEIGGPGLMEKIAKNRAVCIWNIQAIDGTSERDTHIHIPFRWDWKSSVRFLTPPPGFDPTKEPPDPVN